MNSSTSNSDTPRRASGPIPLLRKGVTLAVLVFATYAAILALVDPYHKVHTRVFGLQEQRMLSPMLLRRYAATADGLLTGSSMVENFAVSQFKEELGFSLIKVPLEGATAYESRRLIEYALRHAPLRHVVFGLDLLAPRGAIARVHDSDTFRDYLYEDSPLSFARYFTDTRLVAEVQAYLPRYITAIAHHQPLDSTTFDFDEYSNWGAYFTYATSNAVASYEARKKTGAGFGALHLKELLASFDANVMPWVREHPDVHFLFLYPPYSRLFWTECIENGSFDTLMEFKRQATERLLACENAEVHDFQVWFEVSHDLDRYKDLTHYSPEVSQLMVRALRTGEYRVTSLDYRKKIDDLVADSRRETAAYLNPPPSP